MHSFPGIPPAAFQSHFSRIKACSYQFLEGEYVWISSKNLSGWCRG